MPTRAQFTAVTAGFIPAVVASIAEFGEVRRGWLGWFTVYDWRHHGWEEGLQARVAFRNRLAAEEPLAAVLGDILEWGGDRYGAYVLDEERVARIALDLAHLADQATAALGVPAWVPKGMTLSPHGVGRRAIPMTTKFYCMADPLRYVIYDQHVARALLQLTGAVPGWPQHIAFAQPAGLASGGGQQGLHDAGQTFLNASWLAQDIASHLQAHALPANVPAPDLTEAQLGERWMACHVEMALFMLGQAIKRQGPNP